VLIASIIEAVSVAIDLDEVTSGESGLAVGIDTILVGFALAGIRSVLAMRLLRREQTDGLGALLARRDLILRMRVRSSQQEGTILTLSKLVVVCSWVLLRRFGPLDLLACPSDFRVVPPL
jgi:hypothetical protein